METIPTLLNEGVAHHRAGRLAEAEAAYRRVLAAQPDNPDALHLLGVIATQVGRAEAGLPLLRRAVQLLPDVAEFHLHLGQALHAVGQREPALASLAEAIRL
jgi:Flp pilus assembly protein TadD